MLPWLFRSVKDQGSAHREAAEKISLAAESKGHKTLSRVFAKYSEVQVFPSVSTLNIQGFYDSMENFLSDLAPPLIKIIGKNHLIYTLHVLFGLVDSCNGLFKIVLLQLIW